MSAERSPGRSIIEARLADVSSIPAAQSNPNSAAFRQRVVLEKLLEGRDVSPAESAYVSGSLRPSVRQVMDLGGVDFNTAGTLLGNIGAIQQESLRDKRGRQTPVMADFSRLLLSDVFGANPGTALNEVYNQLRAASGVEPQAALQQDFPNFVLQKSGPGMVSGWYPFGGEPVPYVSADEIFAYLVPFMQPSAAGLPSLLPQSSRQQATGTLQPAVGIGEELMMSQQNSTLPFTYLPENIR